MKQVVIIGGGICGLLTAIQLVNAGLPCVVIEKKKYPFHRVCGEYISNETVPFLKSLKLFPEQFDPPHIQRFQLSSVNGKSITLPLDLGGFGISRYCYDHFLYQHAANRGVAFLLEEEVEGVQFESNNFRIKTEQRELEADLVIGAYGKRSKLDISLDRSFIKKRSPFVGIKYHILTDHPTDLIALHNFRGGYCGISNVEGNKSNLCYLTHRENLRQFRNIRDMEQGILFQNPILKKIFLNAEFIFEKPETINEISFETKLPVENHVLMAGDAAGMIAPLCGNGMAMAIHTSKILSELLVNHLSNGTFDRAQLARSYNAEWNKIFKKRLAFGRQVQRMFGNEMASKLAVSVAINIPPIANLIMKNTHGDPF